MTSCLHARVPVLENVRLARDTWRVRLAAPALAQSIGPGQFLMMRLPGHSDPLLGRPFALYDTVLDANGNAVALDVVYLVVGKLTTLLAQANAGDELEVWGPLGNGFQPLTDYRHVALVAGGIGQTPFLAYIRELLGTRGCRGAPAQHRAQKVSLYYGVRTADLAAGVDDFRSAGAEVHLASDDGSLGYRGFVTDLLSEHLARGNRPSHVIGCGPEPMLHALALLAANEGIPCHLSLETPMACGLGICFSCVTKVKTATGWDYQRVCVEGPIFDTQTLCIGLNHS